MTTAYKTADYSPEKLTLTVTFNDGRSYTYHAVSPKTWKELQASPSKGKFLQHVIRSSHRMTK